MAGVVLWLGAGCATTGKTGGAAQKVSAFPLRQGQAYAHYLAGIMHDQRGESSKASLELEAACGLDPGSATPLLRLIRSYIRDENYDKAIEMIERAQQQIPNSASLYIVEGRVRQEMKQYDEAAQAFKRAIELNPENPFGYGALVDMQETTNDLVSATDIYERLLELNPDSALLQFRLGLNLIRMQDLPAARQHLEKALALDPKMERVLFFLGVTAFDSKDLPAAEKYFKEYLALRPADMDAMEYMAATLGQAGRYSEAAQWIIKASQGPEAKVADSLAAMVFLIQGGQPARAEKIAPPSGAPVLGALLTAAAREKQRQPTQPILQSLDGIETDLEQECAEALNRTLFLVGNEKLGGWLLEQVVSFAKLTPSKNLGLIQGRILMELDRYREAAPVLQSVLESFGSNYLAHYYLAQCFEKLKQPGETEEHLKACLSFNPDNADLLNFLGYFYADQNVKLEEAQRLIEKALEIDPDNAFYLDSLGWLYYRKGDAEKAVEYIQKALYGMENDDAVLRSHLGDAYWLSGKAERALTEWKKAVRLDPKLKDVQEKIEKNTPPAEPKTER